MNTGELARIAQQIVAPHKGVLAADESTGTIKKRFAQVGIDSTEESRRAYRQLLFTTREAAPFIGGVILYDETLRQSADDGRPFPRVLADQGIVPGIKVDAGAKPLAGSQGETVTEGLDGLRERLAEYHRAGARFTKWRAVIAIGSGLPTTYCMHVNAHALARYAALAQEAGMVPIVEPEVLMDGSHSLERCAEVTEEMLRLTFAELAAQRVVLEGMLLKPNMVVAGKEAQRQPTPEEVARETCRVLARTVPAAVPGIVFLSGGQSEIEATANLDAMNRMGPHPWVLSFSYGRALQKSALETWKGRADLVPAAQRAYAHRARCNGAASRGEYSPAMEKEHARTS